MRPYYHAPEGYEPALINKPQNSGPADDDPHSESSRTLPCLQTKRLAKAAKMCGHGDDFTSNDFYFNSCMSELISFIELGWFEIVAVECSVGNRLYCHRFWQG